LLIKKDVTLELKRIVHKVAVPGDFSIYSPLCFNLKNDDVSSLENYI
jgi:hypothetical protein